MVTEPARPAPVRARPIGRAVRLAIVVTGVIALITGALGGLVRAGWWISTIPPNAVALHGAIMASGFFGTLITLERAVALQRRWAFAAAALSGLGGLLLLAGAPWRFGASACAAGSLGFVAASALVFRRQPAQFTGLLALGAGSLLVGNILWLAGSPMPEVALWWMAFLILTIAGERLELTRLLPIPPQRRLFFTASAVLLLAAVALASWAPAVGRTAAGVLLLVLAGWALVHDVARRTIRQTGLPRFAAANMLTAYGWLVIAGLLLIHGRLAPGLEYDATLHATFLGFAFSMVLGHAPIIFPAVLRLTIPYSAVFYVPAVALQASVLIRVTGDLLLRPQWRMWGALGNAVALALFLLTVLASVLRGALGRRPRSKAGAISPRSPARTPAASARASIG